jgi:hypothetical protein
MSAPRSPLRALALVAALSIATSAAAGATDSVTVLSAGTPAFHPWPVRATLAGPTNRYSHNVLGDIPGFGELLVEVELCRDCPESRRIAHLTLPDSRVFEDVAPRLWDVTGDGRPEIVLVESDVALGARLTMFTLRAPGAQAGHLVRRLASSDFIGTRFRWLAPVGVADFTGNGAPEIAWVETPHLGRTLRLARLQGDRLAEIAAHAGVTNHRIGDPFIAGGLRDCGAGPEIVLARADWSRAVALRYGDRRFAERDLGPIAGPRDLAVHLSCPP